MGPSTKRRCIISLIKSKNSFMGSQIVPSKVGSGGYVLYSYFQFLIVSPPRLLSPLGIMCSAAIVPCLTAQSSSVSSLVLAGANIDAQLGTCSSCRRGQTPGGKSTIESCGSPCLSWQTICLIYNLPTQAQYQS